jgi:hypothetical protein
MITEAEVSCVLKPSMVLTRWILAASLRMIRQLPTAVPTPIIEAHTRMTHRGMAKTRREPAVTNASAMTPMVLCESLVP